jgi:cyclase
MVKRKIRFQRSAYWTLGFLLIAGAVADGGPRQKPAEGTGISPTSAAPGELTRLADGVYVRIVGPDSDEVSNSGVILLESGVLIFDTHFTPEAGESLLEKVKGVTPHPVRYIVNSHFHSDHTHGNQAFAAARQILGSTNTRRSMLQKDLAALNQARTIAQKQVEQLANQIRAETDVRRQDALRAEMKQRLAFMQRMSVLRILAPGVTLDDNLAIVDSGREINLVCMGTGHTDGDIMLYLPQEKIAFLGDLFFHDAIPNVEDAIMLDWMKTLREAIKLDASVFVPGHGPVGTRADVEAFLRYFEDINGMVEAAAARGDTLEQVVSDLQVPAKYGSYAFQNLFPANLQKMYAEIKAAKSTPASPEAAKKQGFLP